MIGSNDDSEGVCSHLSLKRDADTWVRVQVTNRGQAWGAAVTYRLRIATVFQIAPTATPTAIGELVRTPTAMPTYAPWPTYTPLPTYTPQPTAPPVPYASPLPFPTAAVAYPTSVVAVGIAVSTPTPFPAATPPPVASATSFPLGGALAALGNVGSSTTNKTNAAAALPQRASFSLYVDDNNDKLLGLTEAAGRVLIVARAGTEKWSGYTDADGRLTLPLPALAAGTVLQWEAPYLHRTGQIKLDGKLSEFPVELRLEAVKYPLYLP